jgi:hypothetical protein
MVVILRHHEVFLYKRFCRENGIKSYPGQPDDPPSIGDILARCKPDDILGHESVLRANDALRSAEEARRACRDEWIKLYTGAISSAPA